MDMVSGFTMQLTIEDLPFIKFSRSIKEEHLQLCEKAIKKLPPFLTTYLYEARIPSYASTKATDYKRIDTGVHMRILQSSIEQTLNICKNIK